MSTAFGPGSWMNFYANPNLPEDPGGPLTWEREGILRQRAESRLDYGMLDVLNALEDERRARSAAECEAAMLRRCLCDGTDWLAAEVETMRAVAIQADRALAMADLRPRHVARRWWTHAQHPDPDDLGRVQALYDIARRVLYQVSQ